MINSSGNFFSRPLLSTIAMLVITLLVPAIGYASAYGYAYWGTTMWRDIPIPKGQLFHAIEGKGQHIDRQGGNYGAVGNLCDTSVRFTYGGKNGKWTHYFDSDVRSGCSAGNNWKYAFNWKVPIGDACMELWMKKWAKMVVRQCHYIH
jgi:hypothetical protein